MQLNFCVSFLVLFILNFYLFMRDREREAETHAEGEAGSMHAGSPTWDSIPGLQDHTPGRRPALNR